MAYTNPNIINNEFNGKFMYFWQGLRGGQAVYIYSDEIKNLLSEEDLKEFEKTNEIGEEQGIYIWDEKEQHYVETNAFGDFLYI